MDGWTPFLRLTNAAGGDITPFVSPRLVSMSYEEQAQDRSDRLTLTLDDREIDGLRAQLPEPDARITLEIGYREADDAYKMGTFRVDEYAWDGPPDRVQVVASGAALSTGIRSPETRSWHETTIGEIARTIAGEHGLQVRTAGGVGEIAISHADQQAESPMAFLTRLTKQHDAVARPLGDTLAIVPKGQQISATGRSLPTFGLGPGDVSSWSYSKAYRRSSASGEDGKGGVTAFWRDTDQNDYRTISVGDPPFAEMPLKYDSREQAIAAAQARLNENERSKDQLTLTMPGRPDLVTEARLDLLGWRPQLPVHWRIKRISHTIDAKGGFTTEVDAERLRLDQTPVPDIAA